MPAVAREYYETDDTFLFDLVSHSCRTDPTPTPTPNPDPNQVSQSCRTDRVGVDDGCPRRPKLQSLYDVFECIRNDEKEVRRFVPQSTPRRPPSTTLPHTNPNPNPTPNPNP